MISAGAPSVASVAVVAASAGAVCAAAGTALSASVAAPASIQVFVIVVPSCVAARV
jgi:hypothetical protein